MKEQFCTEKGLEPTAAEMTAPFLDADDPPVNLRLVKVEVDRSDLADDSITMSEAERVTGELGWTVTEDIWSEPDAAETRECVNVAAVKENEICVITRVESAEVKTVAGEANEVRLLITGFVLPVMVMVIV